MKKDFQSCFRERIAGIFILIVCGFAVIMARQLWMQGVDNIMYSSKVKEKQDAVKGDDVEKRGLRGTIYDRNHHVLAASRKRRIIYCHPDSVKDAAKTSALLAPILKMEQQELFKILDTSDTFAYLNKNATDEMCLALTKLKDDVSLAVQDGKVKDDEYSLNAIEIDDRIKSGFRYYPKGRLASQVLGFVQIDEEHDEDNGGEGLEAFFDPELSPKTVFSMDEQVDSKGNVVPGAPVLNKDQQEGNESLDGNSIILTIDEFVQFVAEDELKKQVVQFGAAGGSVLILDARSADVLAMATYPDFAPEQYYDYPASSYRNKIACDFYEPGSIFKVLTACAAIKNGYSITSQVYCPDTIPVGGEVIHNAEDGLNSRGTETIADVIAYSFNTGTVSLAMSLGAKALGTSLEEFGIGQTTGIEVYGESCGLFPSWKNWSNLTLANISFGQAVGITPLQLASAVQGVANDGVRMKPHLVKAIVTADGKEIKEYSRLERDPDNPSCDKKVTYSLKPEVLSRPISKEEAKEIRSIMAGVVSVGSGKRARVPGYKVGGKTGTAQIAEGGRGYLPNQYTAGFVGIAPIEDPAVVIVIKIDRPTKEYYGGRVAAPVFSNICKRILPVLGVPPVSGYVQEEYEPGNIK
ncbi:MAG: peptidoglycan D,D-transpeptidase FtsI family protein [Candidatus Bruticola sp.]